MPDNRDDDTYQHAAFCHGIVHHNTGEEDVTFGFQRNPDIAEERKGRAEAGPAVVIDYQ